MGRRVVHSLGAMQPDMRYVREGLRFAADLHRAGKFGEMAETLRELSAILTDLEGKATDNFYGVEDCAYKSDGFYPEVNASDDVRKAEKWHAHRLELLAKLERPAGDPFAVTSAEVSAALASHGVAEGVFRN